MTRGVGSSLLYSIPVRSCKYTTYFCWEQNCFKLCWHRSYQYWTVHNTLFETMQNTGNQLRSLSSLFDSLHTAKTQYRKFETNIPRKRIAWPQSQSPYSCVCERFVYSHDRSAYSAAGKYVDPILGHECGNWDCGSAIPFLVIHKWDFRCSALQPVHGLA